MKILVSQIDPNPHRDLERNPISEEQVSKLITSIRQTGFWDNAVVRPHPDQPGRFQLAHGHNRIEACRRLGMTEVDLPSRDLSDYQMLCMMISENHTQQGTLPPRVIFENAVAALRLAERLLSSTSTVEEFNELLKLETCSNLNKSSKWSAIQYGQAKSALSETGDGLGRGFLKGFMPEGTLPSNETVQNVVDAFYQERRKLAAERRALAAEEARRAALAEKETLEEQAKLASEREESAKREVEAAKRKERDAAELAEKAEDEKTKQAALRMIDKQRAIRQKAVRRADQTTDQKMRVEKAIEQTQQKIAEETKKAASERARVKKFAQSVIDQDLLQRLDSTSKMNDVIRLVKKNKIPKQYHAELVERAASWSADSQTTHMAGTSISIRGGIWWENISGEYSERMRAMKERIRQQELTEKLGSRPVHKVAAEIISDYARALRKTKEPAEHLKMVAEHFGSIREKELQQVQDYLIRLDGALTDKANEVKAMIRGNNVLLQAREKEVNPPHESLQIEMQRDAVRAEIDEPIEGDILSIDEAGATASTAPRIEGRSVTTARSTRGTQPS